MTVSLSTEPERPGSNAAKRLRLTRTLLMLICVVAGVVVMFASTSASSGLDAAGRSAQQVLKLQEIRSYMVTADGLATSGIAQGKSESAPHRQSYLDSVRAASSLTAEASKNMPSQQAALEQINAQMIDYIITMESARSSYAVDAKVGQDVAGQASKILSDKIVRDLDVLIKSSTVSAQATGFQGFSWAGFVALLPAIAVLAVSVWMAMRSKRLLNIGLTIAVILLVVMWRFADDGVSAVSRVSFTAAGSPMKIAMTSSVSAGALAEAKEAEGFMTLNPSTATERQAAWSKAMDIVEGTRPDHLAEQVKTYRTEHAQLLVAIKSHPEKTGEWVAQHPTLNQSYTELAKGLKASAKENAGAAATKVEAAKSSVEGAKNVAIVLSLLGAVASAMGISQRLRDYR